jgi:hypothetical protein
VSSKLSLAAAVLLPSLITSAAFAADARAYLAGHPFLRIDGLDAGPLREADGGNPYGEVVLEPPAAGGVVRKHLGGVRYEDITVVAGSGMSRGFWSWLQDMTEGRALRRNGELVAADYNNKEQSVLAFDSALITEVTFPALDASSKENATLAVTLSPEVTRRRKGTGAAASPKLGSRQKAWLASNFRFNLANLPTQRVSRVDSFTIRQPIHETPVGGAREPERAVGALELSALVITLPESDAEPFFTWLDDFVVKGNDSADKERTGSLQLLSPDLKSILFELAFQGVGITRITSEPGADGKETVPRVRVELYVETVKLTPMGEALD